MSSNDSVGPEIDPANAAAEAIALEISRRVVEQVRRSHVRETATYRLQLHRDFTFYQAIEILPYLKELGISHVYCSPYLKARAGSQHGYDICDHTQFNPELGGEPGYLQFVAALREYELGQILDIVPNHMAASLENPAWYDVLENGPASPYSQFFDIDWDPIKQELNGKVLLPVLGQQYGEALEDGQLKLVYLEGAFSIHYYDSAFPLGPKTAVPLLTHRLEELRAALGEADSGMMELESIVTSMEHLPPQTVREPAAIRERQREKEIVKRRLRELVDSSPAIRDHLAGNVEEFSGNREHPESFDRLDQLLDAQPYRLSHWRSAADEINYRRFFDVNELAAICMESPEVFHATHALLRPYLANGTISGLRIDHVDGLYDPEQYLWRLQWAYLADLGENFFNEQCPAVSSATNEHDSELQWRDLAPRVLAQVSYKLGIRQPGVQDLRAVLCTELGWEPEVYAMPAQPKPPLATGSPPLTVLVEKILGPDEPLPDSWPVAGTSGYDFLNSLSGLFLVPQGYTEIVRNYDRLLDTHLDLNEVEYDAKLLILRVAMASELQMLAQRLNRISEQHRRSRDFTLNTLRLAIREVLACFPVYRIYPGKEGISDRDRKIVHLAVARARRRNPAFDPAVFEFLRSVLLLSHPPGLSPEQIEEREVFTGKFQQVTSPVMAKGVEDTAFYVHIPLVSANEVGSHPAHAATTIAEFHEANRQRNTQLSRAMLTTSTHDTKRSEDLRARLHVLTEVPHLWRAAVSRFSRANKRLLREVDGEPAPSKNDEYLFYQSLLGIWPLSPPDDSQRQQLVERLTSYMEKATREAKQRTSWMNPNEDYDTAVREFVTQSLSSSPKNKFLAELSALHAKIAPAGQYNALGQAALKLLSPGIPDIYQGEECWNFSLVDPDNRRAVDYAYRQKTLHELQAWGALPNTERRALAIALGRSWNDPRLKLFVTHQLLHLRNTLDNLFVDGEYVPLESTGPRAEHLVAFGWRRNAEHPLEVIAVVPRWLQSLLAERPVDAGTSASETPLWIADSWRETEIQLPSDSHGNYRCIFTGSTFSTALSTFKVCELLNDFPLAVLRREA